MSTAGYLQKFRSGISQGQYEKLTRTLNSQNQQGQFSNYAQFRERLDNLTRELFEKRIAPLFTLYTAIPGQPIDSETYNFMLGRLQDDLEIAFAEAGKIGDVLRAHDAIVRDMFLKDLKNAVADLERQVATHELVVNSPYAFQKTLFSNFSGAGDIRESRSVGTEGLFVDPRTGERISSVNDGSIDRLGRYLVLPLQNSGYIQPNKVRQIFDFEAVASEKNVQTDDLRLQNLIDNTNNTYWSYLYLFKEASNSKVTTKLEFDFGGQQEINFLEIDPALLFNVELSKIIYFDHSGTAKEIPLGLIISRNKQKVQFSKIATSKVILVFENENAIPVNYVVRDLVDPLTEVISEALIEQLGRSREWVTSEFSGRQFQIGFDNIRFGMASYKDMGAFVSKPLEIGEPVKLIGFTCDESRPAAAVATPFVFEPTTDTYDNDDYLFGGSVEYWVLRKLLASSGSLLSFDVFPILPIGRTRVNHEVLVLTHRFSTTTLVDNVGRLMFYVDPSSVGDGTETGNVRVYRNGILLTKIADESSGDGWWLETRLSQDIPGVNVPMATAIGISQARIGDRYTVSYTPTLSNVLTKEKVSGSAGSHQYLVDLAGDLTARPYLDQVVLSESMVGTQEVGSVEMRLMVIMRRSVADESLSPYLRSFILAGSTQGLNEPEDELNG
jgi:hypothetical protein